MNGESNTEIFSLHRWSFTRLIGLFFLLPGLGAFGAGLAGQVHWEGSDEIVPPWIICPFACIFILMGIWFLAGWTALVVNRGSRQLEVRKGLVVPFLPVKTVPFESLMGIALFRDVDSDRDDRFALLICHYEGEPKTVRYDAGTKWNEALAFAKRLASALQVPFVPMPETTERPSARNVFSDDRWNEAA